MQGKFQIKMHSLEIPINRLSPYISFIWLVLWSKCVNYLMNDNRNDRKEFHDIISSKVIYKSFLSLYQENMYLRWCQFGIGILLEVNVGTDKLNDKNKWFYCPIYVSIQLDSIFDYRICIFNILIYYSRCAKFNSQNSYTSSLFYYLLLNMWSLLVFVLEMMHEILL